MSLGLALSASALANPYTDQIAAARAALESKDGKAALAALDAAEDAGPVAGEVVTARQLSLLWYYRGLARRMVGDKKNKAMEDWRQALVVDNELKWDEALIDDGDAWSLFEALRSEVRGRPTVDVGVPEPRGAAVMWVDGEKRVPDDTVFAGTHLAQIKCDDGSIHGAWSTFKKPPKWLKLCPNGVDTSVVVAQDEDEGDEWSDFGPAFGGGVDSGGEDAVEDVPDDEDAAPVGGGAAALAAAAGGSAAAVAAQASAAGATSAAPPAGGAPDTPEGGGGGDAPLAEGPAVADQPVPDTNDSGLSSAPVAEAAPVEADPPVDEVAGGSSAAAAPPPPAPESDAIVAAPAPSDGGGFDFGLNHALYAGGGALLVSSVAVNFLVVNPAWSDVEAAQAAPASLSREEADALTKRFNVARISTIALGVAGAGAVAGGFFVDTRFSPIAGPGILGLAGSF